MKRLLIALALLLASLPTPASADHVWGGVHWQRGGAHTYGGYRFIGVHNGADRSPTWQAMVNEAADRWTDTNWHPAVLAPVNLPESQWPWPCNWTPPPAGWGVVICYGSPSNPSVSAETQVSRDAAGHLLWAKITIRPGLHPGYLTTVLTHELGHALGLVHNPTEHWSVMSPDGGYTGWPSAHDQNTVAYLYAHSH